MVSAHIVCLPGDGIGPEIVDAAKRLLAELGGPKAWAERVGSVPPASFTVTKWAWLREEEPEAAAATRAVRLPHDYLTGRLTGQGVEGGTTDRGDASGSGWWSTATQSYDEEILAHVGLDPALLPRVVAPGEPSNSDCTTTPPSSAWDTVTPMPV